MALAKCTYTAIINYAYMRATIYGILSLLFGLGTFFYGKHELIPEIKEKIAYKKAVKSGKIKRRRLHTGGIFIRIFWFFLLGFMCYGLIQIVFFQK